MTNREFYAKIAALTNVDSELVEFAADSLAKMDAQATARRAKQAEKAPLRDALLEVMGDADEPKTASMLIEETGLSDTVKPASVPSLLRPLVESGLVLKVDVKVAGKGTQRGYIKA